MERSALLKIFSVTTLSLLGSGNIFAATTTSNFNVTATVSNACQNLSANNISFGTYDPLSGSDSTSTGSISVQCTKDAAYALSLSTGSSSSYTNRTMSNGTDTINYNLYNDSGHTTVWGDGTNSTSTVSGTATGGTDSSTVYAKATAGQSVSAGSYSDTITVTITY